jgi:hypothetical protein
MAGGRSSMLVDATGVVIVFAILGSSSALPVVGELTVALILLSLVAGPK